VAQETPPANSASSSSEGYDDEDNGLTSIDVQEGDRVKLECRYAYTLGMNIC
jgi:hypothetical protein